MNTRSRPSRNPRVVVTGLGALTPLAIGVEESWHALCNGVSGIDHVTHFDTTNLRTKIAGRVKNFDIGDFDDRRFEKRYDRFVNLAVAAAHLACRDAELRVPLENAQRTGVILGNCLGGVDLIEDNVHLVMQGHERRVSPFFIPGIISNMASGLLAIIIGAHGPNMVINAACASGTHAIGYACRLIQNGEADIIIAGGAETGLSRIVFCGYTSMRATSARNDEPTKASRPFDQSRDGFVPAEGAGLLVLESLESARRRGVRIYAEVSGYGASCDAFHITGPDPQGDGAVRSMQMALDDAHLSASDIDCINAHGTSTPQNDATETLAIRAVFKDRGLQIPVTANKSMIGHTVGAAGALEAIFSILSIRDGIIPPTINYETPDPDCNLDYVPNQAQRKEVTAVLSNSFGFGGTNASLVIEKFPQNKSS